MLLRWQILGKLHSTGTLVGRCKKFANNCKSPKSILRLIANLQLIANQLSSNTVLERERERERGGGGIIARSIWGIIARSS